MGYTQAVIMHIHTAVSHFLALATMAQEYMILVENQQCLNFIQDIQNLHDGGHLEWNILHIYQIEGSADARGTFGFHRAG